MEWMIDGEILPSSWSMPRAKVVVSHLELKLIPEYDQKYLTCRIITQSSGEKSLKTLTGSTKLSPKTKDYNNMVTVQQQDNDVLRSERSPRKTNLSHKIPESKVSHQHFGIDSESFKLQNSTQENEYSHTHFDFDYEKLDNSSRLVQEETVGDSSSFHLSSVSSVQKRNDDQHINHQVNHGGRNQVQFSLKSHKKQESSAKFHKVGIHKEPRKYKKHRIKNSWKWEATVTDISVLINMFCEYKI